MALRYFVRIFQQGGCRPGPSAPAEGSTCLAKRPVVAAFLRGAPLSCPRAASPPAICGVSSKALERARHSLSVAVLARETDWQDRAQETGPREPPGMDFGEAFAGGTSGRWFSVTARYRGAPAPRAACKATQPLSRGLVCRVVLVIWGSLHCASLEVRRKAEEQVGTGRPVTRLPGVPGQPCVLSGPRFPICKVRG